MLVIILMIAFLYCSHLFVIVTTNKTIVPNQVPDSDLVSYSKSDKLMYVTAVVRNMSGDQWEKKIVIGNGRNVTGVGKEYYYNAPLNKDNTYYIFVRAYAFNHSDSVR